MLLPFSLIALTAGSAFSQNPQYSDKDKKKLAEISARPEVIREVQQAWDATRRRDMDYAYHVNRSSVAMQSAGLEGNEFRAKYGQIYDNPALVMYVNRVGQKLVPKGSVNTLTFRVLLDPIPRAEALTTGTVYISTGLIALLDDEAQLSYVLGHEVAHVEKAHAYNRIRNTIYDQKLGAEKESDTVKKKAIFSVVTSMAGAAIGGGLGGASGALSGGLLGGVGGLAVSQFLVRNHFEPTDWSTVEENEADEAGMRYMLNQRYDPREVPRMLARLDKTVTADTRVGLGFIGSPARVKERIGSMQTLLDGAVKADLETKLKAGNLTTSSADFPLLMAALKRDNGIEAMDYDLFAMSRDNLEDSLTLRADDARAQSYLGRLMLMTGRGADEHGQALEHLRKAVSLDRGRGAYPEPHLDQALLLMEDHTPTSDAGAQTELKTYVALYQREHSGVVPGNMHILYDYMTLTGDSRWYLAGSTSVTARNGESVRVSSGGSGGAETVPSAEDVVLKITGAPMSASGFVQVSAPAPSQPASPAAAKPSRTSTHKPQ